VGLLVNAALAATKLVAGVVGHAYALVADAVESSADVLSSAIVWGGLAISAQPADESHPFGHGKAEALAAAVVSIMLIGAAVGIGIQAVREIRTPHHLPAPWTLAVLVGVMLVKWLLSRRVHAVATQIGSTAVRADAWHHLSDAVTSAAAFIGISVALVGNRVWGGPGWAAADDWAALAAAAIIGYNGVTLLRPTVNDLMDRMAGEEVVNPIRRIAEGVPGVMAIEKLHVRKAGLAYSATIHVQADPRMRLDEAHALGGRVKSAIRTAMPEVQDVLVHMEPYTGNSAAADAVQVR
jgi:cation diffusion facilitator family transporter